MKIKLDNYLKNKCINQVQLKNRYETDYINIKIFTKILE